MIREYEMLAETAVTVLSERRAGAPYGALGGEPGLSGRNVVIREGREEVVGGKVWLTLNRGDRLRIESPAGGGFGSRKAKDA